MLHADHGIGSDDYEHHIGDGVVGPLVFGLGVLECVNVLGDFLVFEMVTLHLFLQCEDIKGVKPTTRRLEVSKKFPRDDQGVVGLGTLEFLYPHACDNTEEEFTPFAFHSFISGEVADAGILNDFLPCFHRCLLIYPDGHIVYGSFLGAGVSGGVIFRVRFRVFNDSNEVM